MSGLGFEKSLPEAIANAENLPSLPSAAVEILRLCEDDRSTLDDLADAVQQDPALAVKMLQLANSSLFSLGQDVSTVKHAAMVLGMKTVKLMSLSFSLAQCLPKHGEPGFDYGAYWRRSLMAAVAGRALARRQRSGLGDEAFLVGLLSHLGQLILAECLREIYHEVLEDAGEAWPTLEQEELRMGFNHADVAGTLLARWNLPELIYVPVAYLFRTHELTAGASPEAAELAQLMSSAMHVVGLFCDLENGEHLQALEETGGDLGIAPHELESFLLDLEPAIEETASMLSIDLPQTESHAEILTRARSRIVQISLNTSADLQQAERRASSLENENQELLKRALTDKLTGLANRAAFDERLAEEIQGRIGRQVPRALGLVLLDIDHFKRFNDTHGHQAGDAVLAKIGEVLAGSTRKGDFCARYGGEEFAIVLPRTTPTFLRMVAGRVRAAIEAAEVEFEGQTLRVTASFGGACLANANSPKDGGILIMLADRLLYRAKENGRNRVEIYSHTRLPSYP